MKNDRSGMCVPVYASACWKEIVQYDQEMEKKKPDAACLALLLMGTITMTVVSRNKA